jgi:hypothetical protein
VTGPPDDIDALRAAFEARRTETPLSGCPDAERIWQAARDELTAPERREIVAHTTKCPACAAAWRLARELGGRPAVSSRPHLRWALPAAAAVLLAVGGGLLIRSIGGPPEYRNPSGPVVESRTPETLPRDRFVLRWIPGREGSRCDVWVTTETLEPVHVALQLERPELHVPENALAALPAGTRLRWRVECRPRQGETTRSPAFAVRVD